MHGLRIVTAMGANVPDLQVVVTADARQRVQNKGLAIIVKIKKAGVVPSVQITLGPSGGTPGNVRTSIVAYCGPEPIFKICHIQTLHPGPWPSVGERLVGIKRIPSTTPQELRAQR